MTLRPYQERALRRIRVAAAAGHRRICVVLPTGAGKTIVLAALCQSVVVKGGSALWLAHRAELVEQAALALAGLGLRVGVVSASAAGDLDAGAPVQVATVQTLIARQLRPPARIIVADEAHHYAGAATWHALVRDYPEAWVLGPTATPERGDGVGLGELYTTIVVGATVAELTRDGYLVPAEIIRPARRLRPGEVAQSPLNAYQRHAAGRRAIAYLPTVALARACADAAGAAGLRAALLTGLTPWAERRETIARLRAGELDLLANCQVATEGLDAPEVDCIILARGCATAGSYLQIVGRALRPAPGKLRALVLDLVGASHVHGHPADERAYSLDGRGIRRADDDVDQAYCRVCGAALAPGQTCPECGTAPRVVEQIVTGDALEPYAWIRRDTAEQRIARLARWIAAGRAGRTKAGAPYSPRWAHAKFSALYGAWPSPAELFAAQRRIEGR